jgi:ABC-2 type transport system ATP-binding protein
VERVEIRGDSVFLHARETDGIARYLLNQTSARDLEITSRNLEEAFLALTADDVPEATR